MFLPPCSSELNPIEQIWMTMKESLKRHRMLTEENLSSRISDAYKQVLIKGSKLISAIFRLPSLVATAAIRDRHCFAIKDTSYTDNSDLLDMSQKDTIQRVFLFSTLQNE